MTRVLAAWNALPVLLQALLLGWVVMELGVFGFGAIVYINRVTTPLIPWAALAMVPFLYLYWQYIGGRWWPSSTSQSRRDALRANCLSATQWAWAALAIVSGLIFTLCLNDLWGRLTGAWLDPADMFPPNIPFAVLIIIMTSVSIVAGFAEEAGMRGYLQSMVERRYGPVLAIALSASVFTLAHFGYNWGAGMAVPFLLSGIWYGALTWAGNSIWPMVLAHIALDFILFGRLFVQDAQPPVLLSNSGLDANFWFLGAGLTLGFVGLLITIRQLRNQTSNLART